MSAVINGTNGITFPTWTTGTRPASPAQGQAGYNTTIGAMETYTGSTWSTSDLPAPSTAGNVLTSNGSAWTSAAAPSPSGGATITSSAVDITLTSSSNRVQNVSMTASGKAVILPDATTLSAGGPIFTINNTGYNSFYIKLSTGVITHILAPGVQIQLSLTDNSTAQGQWSNQIGPILFGHYLPTQVDTNTVQLAVNGSTIPYAGKDRVVNQVDNSYFLVQPLTSTTMFIAWIRSDKSVYGCVATNTSGVLSFGTITQIYNGTTTNALAFSGRMLSSTAGIITVDRASNAIAVPITISGTSISVGTASATFGVAQSTANANSLVVTALMPLSATLLGVIYYTAATTFVVNTITHNGASAPTIGTASTGITVQDDTMATGVNLTSTTAQILYIKNANAPSTTGTGTRVVTFSGTSAPTLGTELTTYNNGTYVNMRGIAYSSTETAFLLGDGNVSITTLGLSFTISGTTVTLQKLGTYIGTNSGDATRASYLLNNFAVVNSTTYISTTAYGQAGSLITKWTYVPGDNLFPTSANQTHLMTTKPFGSYASSSSANGALAYNYGGSFATSNTVIPFAGWGGQAMFSGSSTTGLFLGLGVDYTAYDNANTAGSNNYIMAQVFTIL